MDGPLYGSGLTFNQISIYNLKKIESIAVNFGKCLISFMKCFKITPSNILQGMNCFPDVFGNFLYITFLLPDVMFKYVNLCVLLLTYLRCGAMKLVPYTLQQGGSVALNGLLYFSNTLTFTPPFSNWTRNCNSWLQWKCHHRTCDVSPSRWNLWRWYTASQDSCSSKYWFFLD